ncbi:hypothetical protein BDF21DRAFT_450368 [Thamnidium elegans]|uniref:Uncharacterized protein n=1 Tax=Thamnidium elegans TaxID=101142 RepID=A0A8H7SGG2_9FUNG|nr:hypothetical protein INT48_007078 [Thamnidium elegans]KAI8087200.1 hypothetical protein BDF21DRAFT_450368 [Thamnidium elegans]
MQQDSRHPYKPDPYKAVRKPPSPDGYYDSEQIHSRSASESSTTRLSVAPHQASSDIYNGDYYQQDPYAPRQVEKKKKKKRNNPQQPEKRANSYLPYTNHTRDPYSVEPVYLQEEDHLPSFNSPHSHHGRGPVGSILQDNIVMDTINDENDYYDNNNSNDIHKKEQVLPPSVKKSWWVRLGISGKKLVFTIFGFLGVIVIIWYFVWPRTPTLHFLDAGLKSGGIYTQTSMEAVWTVNFTVINEDNWVPTLINNFAVNVLDRSTGEVFGSGNTNRLKLSPRSSGQIIPVDIYINFTRDATSQTLMNLRDSCMFINRDQGSAPKQTLDIQFSIVYYIAGIVWNPISTFSPLGYFQCPMPSS